MKDQAPEPDGPPDDLDPMIPEPEAPEPEDVEAIGFEPSVCSRCGGRDPDCYICGRRT